MLEPQAVSRTEPGAAELVADVVELVSPPDVCVRLLDLVQSGDASAAAIGEVVSQDPNLTARLLRLVNSSYYSLPGRVETVSRATTVVGTRELYSLVLAVSAVSTFSRIPIRLVNMDTFWRHSIYCAISARYLARQCGVLHPERLFVAGLLHDIGTLVLYSRLPEVCRDLLLLAGGDEAMVYEAELRDMGFTHAHVGGLLLATWHLPDALRDAVTWHHDPAGASRGRLEAAIVCLAEWLANRSGIGGFCESPEEPSPMNPEVWDMLGLDEGGFDAEAFMAEVSEQFDETVTLLAVGR